MVDYYAVLQRAVTALDPNTRDARWQLYDRARRTVADRLRSIDPPLSEDEIERSLASVDSAIAQIEYETSRVPPPAPPTSAASDDADARGRVRALVGQRPRGYLYVALAALGLVAIIVGIVAYTYRPRSVASVASPPGRVEAAGTEPSYVYKRQPVYYRTTHPVGSIVVEKSQRFLYFVRPNLVAVRYGIAVGRECADLAGLFRISQKQETVAGVAPATDRPGAESRPYKVSTADAATEPILYLNDSSVRIHAVQTPGAIGRTVATGCIQLVAPDLVDLYPRVSPDARVILVN
jgi:lipoprotein-anchoring transpeptidase ErfK/SrfK